MNRSTQYRRWIRGILGRAAGAALALAILPFTIPGQAQPSLQVLHNHVRPVITSGQAVPVGHLPAKQRLQLAIMLPLRNQAELTSLLDRLYDPTSPDYRQFLSVAQFTERFGPTEQDYQAVVDFAKANGFKVTNRPPNRLLVDVNGSVAQIEKAFHVVMMVYQIPTEKRTFYSPDREPSLDLSVPVSHIGGLDNFSIPRPMLMRAPARQALRGNAIGSGPGGAYLGSDMRAAYYGSGPLTGVGQCVGLMEFDGYNMSDVTGTFDGQSYSVPINNVLIDGASPGSDGDDGEQVVDIVQAISMAPGLSQVRVYIGPLVSLSQTDADIFNSMATEDICQELSVSWGWIPTDSSVDDPIFQEFAAQGQTIFIATGDAGAYNWSDYYTYPGDSDYVVAVGATDLTTNGAGGAWKSETAWLYSTGGINPDGFAIPSWQSGVANSSNGASKTLRNVPDVAAEGDFDNYLCHDGDCEGDWGGTSFAAPRWAGFLALVNEQAAANGYSSLGFIAPTIYPIGKGSSYHSDFHDITSGNNDCCGQTPSWNAVTGYDLVTGWGSPNGQNLINALAGPSEPSFVLTATPNPISVALGDSGTTAVSIYPLYGFSGSVTLSASGLPDGVTATFDTNPATSSSTLTFTVSATAATGTFPVTISGVSGSMTSAMTLFLATGSPSFNLTATPSSLWVEQGSSVTSTIAIAPLFGFSGSVTLSASGLPDGISAAFDTNPTTSTSTLTLTASVAAALGPFTVTINGVSGNLTAATTLILTLPGFSMFVPDESSYTIIQQGGSVFAGVSIQPLYGFPLSDSVALSASGLPNGVTVTFNPNPINYASVSQMTFTASATATLGPFTVTITGVSGSLTSAATLTLIVNPSGPSFYLPASPIAVDIEPGGSGATQISITPWNGFSGSVTLSVSGLPSGVTAAFSPNPTTSTSTLTFTASATAATGTFPMTLSGVSGSMTVIMPACVVVEPNGVNFILSPDFSIVTVVQGGIGANHVWVGPGAGFSGNVTLSASGLPNGVTATFFPNPVTLDGVARSSLLTLTASATAPTGTFTVTVGGVSGSVTNITPITTLIVNPPVTGFALTDTPYEIRLTSSGGSATSAIAVTPINGFSGNVTLAASGLPPGVTASFSPNPATSSSVLTLTSSAAATPGRAMVIITGTSGSLTESAGIELIVNPSPFNLTSTPNAVTIVQGVGSGTSAIAIAPVNGSSGNVTLAVSGLPKGVTASFSPNPATTGSVLTLTASATATKGTVAVTVTGTSPGSPPVSASTTLELTVNPLGNFSLTASPKTLAVAPGNNGSSTITVNPTNNFDQDVTLSASGLPSGVTASFSPNPATNTSTLTLTVSDSAPIGTATITITGTYGSLTHTTKVTLKVLEPNFTLTASPNALTVAQGNSGTSTITINPTNNFDQDVTLSASGLPSGVTASFSPDPATDSSTLTLAVSDSAPSGTSTIAITGTYGSLTHTTKVRLTILKSNFTLTASPNALTVAQGNSGTSTIAINPTNNFDQDVTLSASGLPSGVTASFSPNPATNSSTLTLAVSSSAKAGSKGITITGTYGSLSHTTKVTLTVTKP